MAAAGGRLVIVVIHTACCRSQSHMHCYVYRFNAWPAFLRKNSDLSDVKYFRYFFTIFLRDCLWKSLRDLKKICRLKSVTHEPSLSLSADNVGPCVSSGVPTFMTDRVSRPLVLSKCLLITWWHAFGTLLWSVELPRATDYSTKELNPKGNFVM